MDLYAYDGDVRQCRALRRSLTRAQEVQERGRFEEAVEDLDDKCAS